MSFWTEYSKPTNDQFALLGEITTAWGIIDYELTLVLARLATTPDFMGLSLTDELGFPQRIRAMKNLIDIHRRRYDEKRISAEALAAAEVLVTTLGASKEARNKIAHQIWMRQGDDMLFSVKLRGQQYDDKKTPPKMLFSNSDLRDAARQATALLAQVEQLIELLPEVSEAPRQPPAPPRA